MSSRAKFLAVLGLATALALGVAASGPAKAQVVLEVVELGKDGGGVAVDPERSLVYVAVTGQLNVYQAQTHALISTIPLPQNYTACYDVAVNTVTNRIYAVGFRSYVIDGHTKTVLAHWDRRGRQVVVNPTTNRVYVATIVTYPYTDPHVVHVLDGASNNWLPDIHLGSMESFEFIRLAVNPNTNRVYIAFTGDDTLRVLDGHTHAEVVRLPLENIGHVAANPNTNRVYVGANYVDAVVLDGASHMQVGLVRNIGLGQLEVNQLTNRLYGVGAATPGYVLRFADLATESVVGCIYLDGNLKDYDLYNGLGKVFAVHESYPAGWGKKMTVVQDVSPAGPAPQPTPPCTIATLGLPTDGDGVAVNTTTNRVYVGLDGGVALFDAETLAQLSVINLASDSQSPNICDVGVDETRNRIYALSLGRTYVINGANNQVIGNLGGGDEIAVNSGNGRVYVAVEAFWLGDPDLVKIYDGVALAHVRTINLGTSRYFQTVHVGVNPRTGYAYCTYSLDSDLRIISPTTDDVVQTIDYSAVGTIAVNPSTNRVYVRATRGGQSGAVVLDGDTHAEVGMFQGMAGELQTNARTNRLYGYTSRTLFHIVDGTSGELLGRVFLDGNIQGYSVHAGLSRLYATHADYPEEWAGKVSVIQDTGGPAPPTATPSPTPTRTPTLKPFTPVAWAHLPIVVKQ